MRRLRRAGGSRVLLWPPAMGAPVTRRTALFAHAARVAICCARGFLSSAVGSRASLSTRLREMQAMAQVAQVDRASFMYSSNDQMTSEVKDALSAFDLNKTGSVSTSELVAGAKALQEARSQGGCLRATKAVML